jgi:apolipoprotein N-acyltransferase
MQVKEKRIWLRRRVYFLILFFAGVFFWWLQSQHGLYSPAAPLVVVSSIAGLGASYYEYRKGVFFLGRVLIRSSLWIASLTLYMLALGWTV